MKSSNNINNKSLESNKIILINLILNKIGINTDSYDVQNTLAESQVQSAHDLHDQKIHVLRAALRAVMGDFEMIGHKDNKRTSKELVDVIALYPDALKGKVTTALLDRVLDYTHQFSNQQDISQRTREAEKYRSYTAPVLEQMDIKSVAIEIMKLSTNIEIDRVIFNPPTQKFTNKYVLDGDKFRINKSHQDFLQLAEKFTELEKKYAKSKNELHIQKLNLVRALQQFLREPNQGNFQDLLRAVKNNHRCFEGKDSEAAKLFDSVFAYLGIEQVRIKPSVQQTESEINNLKEQIDIYMANPLIDSTLKEIERLREGIIIKIGPTLQILDELKTSNDNKEKLELNKIGDTYTDGNIQYALGNKVIEFRTELAKQIEEAKSLIEGFDPEKFLKALDDIDNELRFNIDRIKETLLELKEKCEFYGNDERDLEMLKVIRDKIESENNKLLEVLEVYQQKLEKIKKNVVSESVVSDLLGKVSENPNSEVGEKVRQQGKEREERELQIMYQKIDKKHEESKKETEELFRDISQTGVDETYSTTYNVQKVMREAKKEVNTAQEIFDTTMGGLTKIGEDSLKQGVKRKTTYQTPKQTAQTNNQMTDDEFEKLIETAPKVMKQEKVSVTEGGGMWKQNKKQKTKEEEPKKIERKKITE